MLICKSHTPSAGVAHVRSLAVSLSLPGKRNIGGDNSRRASGQRVSRWREQRDYRLRVPRAEGQGALCRASKALGYAARPRFEVLPGVLRANRALGCVVFCLNPPRQPNRSQSPIPFSYRLIGHSDFRLQTRLLSGSQRATSFLDFSSFLSLPRAIWQYSFCIIKAFIFSQSNK